MMFLTKYRSNNVLKYGNVGLGGVSILIIVDILFLFFRFEFYIVLRHYVTCCPMKVIVADLYHVNFTLTKCEAN